MVAAALLVGLLAGALGTWWVQRTEIRYLRDELRVAQDRLLHAWHDKAIIPPRPQEVKPPEPLPPELMDLVKDFESPEGQAAMEAKLRSMHFGQGRSVGAILRQMEDEHPA